MVIETTDGTGSGQRAVITAYDGDTLVASVYPNWTTTPDTTTEYAIRANALYRPISASPEYLTLWAYQHRNSGNSLLRKLFDAMGTFTIQGTPGQLMALAFTFTGRLPAAPTDVSKPSTPTFDTTQPAPLLGADAYLGGAACKFSDFSFDIGNTVQQYGDPTDAFGRDYAQVTMRKSTGQFTPNLALLSSRDAFTDWINSTQKKLWLNWGPAIGKRVSLYQPAIQYTGHQMTDVNDLAGEQLPFRSVGIDAEIYICVW
jgi:hypothetical protein